MKKIVFSLTLVSLAIVLALVACAGKAATSSSTSSGASSGGVSANGTPAPGSNTNQPLPLVSQLLVGTFKLEGTANAVDAKEAASLVPLWQAYAQLTSSNTAAQAEIEAVVSQIQTSMTQQQTQAITAMKLTRQDELTTMSTLGPANFGANGTPGFSGTPRAGGTGGGGAGGFGGGASGGFGGAAGGTTGGASATRSPSQIATLQAARAQSANRIPTSLMNALISLLQKRAGTSS